MKFSNLILLLFLFITPTLVAQVTIGDKYEFDYANPKDYYLGGITVSGVKYLDGNVLIMLSGLSIGEQFKLPGDRISTAVRKLWEQGLFEDIQVSVTKVIDNQVFLDIYLKERPRLSKFQLNGIKKSDAKGIM
jgi:outer membrane protein insertion porin family